MLAHLVSDGRLLELKPSDWTFLLVGIGLCGLITLFAL
jgi:hypothetical protein